MNQVRVSRSSKHAHTVFPALFIKTSIRSWASSVCWISAWHWSFWNWFVDIWWRNLVGPVYNPSIVRRSGFFRHEGSLELLFLSWDRCYRLGKGKWFVHLWNVCEVDSWFPPKWNWGTKLWVFTYQTKMVHFWIANNKLLIATWQICL